MLRQVWDRIMRGLTMRGHGPAIRECVFSAFRNPLSAANSFRRAPGVCMNYCIETNIVSDSAL
jgi:hypothetical protein